MQSDNEHQSLLANRVLLAVFSFTVSVITILLVAEHFEWDKHGFLPRMLIGISGIITIISDRTYVHIFKRNK
jgi:hypothetical protein